MKVICAGASKTGTKSLSVALRELGYEVYDYAENFHYLYDEWMKVFDGKATKEDFQRMLKNVGAGCDMPIFLYWEEILEAFPNAKVVLSLRDDEEQWYNSLKKQSEVLRSSKLFMLPQYITPTGRRLNVFGLTMLRIWCGYEAPSFFSNDTPSKSLFIKGYRQHNATVLQRCPKEKLLVYNVKDGWNPLCNFLGVPIPDKPFPHKNIRGNIVEELMATHPMFKRLQKEFLISLSLISLSMFAGCYCAWKSKFWQKIDPKSLFEIFSNKMSF